MERPFAELLCSLTKRLGKNFQVSKVHNNKNLYPFRVQSLQYEQKDPRQSRI